MHEHENRAWHPCLDRMLSASALDSVEEALGIRNGNLAWVRVEDMQDGLELTRSTAGREGKGRLHLVWSRCKPSAVLSVACCQIEFSLSPRAGKGGVTQKQYGILHDHASSTRTRMYISRYGFPLRISVGLVMWIRKHKVASKSDAG